MPVSDTDKETQEIKSRIIEALKTKRLGETVSIPIWTETKFNELNSQLDYEQRTENRLRKFGKVIKPVVGTARYVQVGDGCFHATLQPDEAEEMRLALMGINRPTVLEDAEIESYIKMLLRNYTKGTFHRDRGVF